MFAKSIVIEGLSEQITNLNNNCEYFINKKIVSVDDAKREIR